MTDMNQLYSQGEKQAERELLREKCNREELAERMAAAIPTDGRSQPLRGLHLIRISSTTEAMHGVAEPSFCVIAQGSKEVCLGETSYQYDPYNYLLTTLDLPIVGRVLQATQEEPYLGLRLILDPTVVGSVLMEISQISPRGQGTVKALSVSRLDATLLEDVLRLVRLLDSPTEARLLFPLITREIVYRLLIGPQGDRLRQMTILGGHTHRIAQAVAWIRKEFNKPLHVEELARQIGMSVSAFHYHFKEVTAMSPLQFQKQLRLQEARQLLLNGNYDAASAGYRVGYEDASHFNREYKRLFGVPPMRDVERLREAAVAGADV